MRATARRSAPGALTLLLAACLVFILPTTAQAGEAHFLLMFAAQRVPNDPDYSHTFTVFVHATWAGDNTCPTNPTLEFHTISWLPATGVVHTAARSPETGHNFALHDTIRLALCNDARVSLWGPYPIKAELYCRGLKRIAELEGKGIQYKANDTGYQSNQVSNCIHAVSTIVDGPRLRVGSPGWGEIASFTVLQRLRPWIVDETPQHWVGAALGLTTYPLIYRGRFTGPRTGAFAGLLAQVFGPEGNLKATYGPPR